MQTIESNKEYKIEFNGSSTWFVSYETEFDGDSCIGAFNTERKARNFFNRTLKDRGYA